MRRAAYVLMAVIWIAGIWIWFHPVPDAPAPKPLQPDVPALESSSVAGAKLDAVALPRQPGPVAAPRHRKRLSVPSGERQPAIVRVKSSVGLPLLCVEVSIAGEEWEQVDLPQSGIEIEPEAYPLRIRAAGHLASDVALGVSEVVLEPDALLTVESAHIRTWAKQLATFEHQDSFSSGAEVELWGKAQKSGILAEFPDANHLLVAFSPAVLVRAFPGDVDVSFRSEDGRPIEIMLRPVSGLRATWNLPAEQPLAAAALDLEVQDEGERPDYVRFMIQEIDPQDAGGTRLEFPWGSVHIGPTKPPEFPDLVWGRPTNLRLEGLPLGGHYYICARDSNDHYGLLDFIHDGRGRKIVLALPYAVVGRVVDAQSSVGIVRPDVRARPPGEIGNLDWFQGAGPTDEQGRFELHLPGMFWGTWSGKPSLDAPERIALVVSGEGYRSAHVEFGWEGRRRVDLGEIALERNAHPIVIGEHDLVIQPWADLSGLTFGDEPALEWAVRHLLQQAEGDHEIELACEANGAEIEPLVSCRDLLRCEGSQRPFVRQPGELLFCSGANGEALAFRRGERGIYHQVPRRLRRVSVECAELPKDGGVWTVGWRGGGTWAGFRKVSAKGRIAAGLALPEMATELWWSAGEAPPDLCKRPGGALALDGNAQTIVLR